MTEPASGPGRYDPVRDLATLLHAALRQGFWQPAARGALTRLEHELGLGGTTLASDIEQALRFRLVPAVRRAAALENAAYLDSLDEQQLKEAVVRWMFERPDRAARLLQQLMDGEHST